MNELMITVYKQRSSYRNTDIGKMKYIQQLVSNNSSDLILNHETTVPLSNLHLQKKKKTSPYPLSPHVRAH